MNAARSIDFVLICDPHGLVRRVMQDWEGLGLAPGTHLQEVFSGDSAPACRELLAAVREQRLATDCLLRLDGPGGTKPVQVAASAIGEEILLCGAAGDASGADLLRELLNAGNALMSRLFEELRTELARAQAELARNEQSLGRLEETRRELSALQAELARKDGEIADLALADALTGLFNRRGFLALAGQQRRLANRIKRGMFLLYADLDGIGRIGEEHGPDMAERALIEGANLLRSTFREADIIARLARGEFAALAADAAPNNAESILARLEEKIRLLNGRPDRLYPLSFHLGLAWYDPEAPCSVEQLLARAEAAMNEARAADDGTRASVK